MTSSRWVLSAMSLSACFAASAGTGALGGFTGQLVPAIVALDSGNSFLGHGPVAESLNFAAASTRGDAPARAVKPGTRKRELAVQDAHTRGVQGAGNGPGQAIEQSNLALVGQNSSLTFTDSGAWASGSQPLSAAGEASLAGPETPALLLAGIGVLAFLGLRRNTRD